MVRAPKFSEGGGTASAGAAFSPSPESGMVTGAFRSGPETTSAAVWPAADGGAKTTLSSMWLPAAKRTGAFTEESENPVPETCKLLRLTGFAVELVILTDWEFF